MSGRRSRNKGARGETAIGHMLTERGFSIIDTPCGKSVPDFIAERDGTRYCVECKTQKLLGMDEWRSQARRQRDQWNRTHEGHHRWMLVAKWPGYRGVFLVELQDEKPAVWRSNASRGEVA